MLDEYVKCGIWIWIVWFDFGVGMCVLFLYDYYEEVYLIDGD